MTVPQVFSWYAANHSGRPAILEAGGALTYGEVDTIASQLARRLLHHGAKPGGVIGTMTNRSAETIIVWLAIVKCGCAYLPLDPAYPAESIGFMIADANPVLIIGETDLLAARPLAAAIKTCSLEQELELASLEDPTGWFHQVGPLDPAYIMYTSGSTGRPKGVIVPHRGIVRLVKDQNYMDFSPDEVYLLISALAFDVSTWEVWGALLTGARIGIVRGARLSVDQIAQGIAEYGVTSIYLTSALFHTIVDVDAKALTGVRQILVGGDVMSPEHSFKAMASLPGCTLINAYGPTEATTYCVCYRLAHEGWGGGPVPIGIPISHTKAYILDTDLTPVADGEVGQLWTGGDGVALGYLNRPDLTAERFRTDPFIADGSLMYFTGDLARMRPDGLIEFLGRNDRQVKIEGKRIELDEIEHSLRQDQRLADVVVALRQQGTDDKRIVAFLKPAQTPPAAGLVRSVTESLRERLPAHMIPNEFAVVGAFPMTPNGKVDRKALLLQDTK